MKQFIPIIGYDINYKQSNEHFFGIVVIFNRVEINANA